VNGGGSNVAEGKSGTVIGGLKKTAVGDYSVAGIP